MLTRHLLYEGVKEYDSYALPVMEHVLSFKA